MAHFPSSLKDWDKSAAGVSSVVAAGGAEAGLPTLQWLIGYIASTIPVSLHQTSGNPKSQ
jgi:hypothetical protein